MPLPNDGFSMQDVQDEFYGKSIDDLKDMLNEIFGTQSGDLKDFGGTGLPNSQNLSHDSVGHSNAELYVDVDPNNVDTTVYFEVSTDGLEFDNPITTGTSTETGNGFRTVNLTASGLSDNTTYYYRALTYNAYNSQGNPLILEQGDFVTESQYFKIYGFTIIEKSGAGYDTEWQYDHGTMSGVSFQYQYDTDSSWQTGVSISDTVNWSNSNTYKSANLTPNAFPPSEASTVQFRARMSASDPWVTSDTYDWTTISAYPQNVTITQPDNTSGEFELDWDNPSEIPNDYSVEVQWYDNGWDVNTEYRSDTSPTPKSTNTYQDGDYAQARVRYVGGGGTTFSIWATSNSVNPVQIDLPTPNPLGWSEEEGDLGLITYSAIWSNTTTEAPIDYQTYTNGSWGSTQQQPAGSTKVEQGINKNSYRIRYNDNGETGDWAEEMV